MMLLLRAFSLRYLVVCWQSLIRSLWLLYWKFSILAECKYENMIIAIEWFYLRRIYKIFIVAAVFCIIWSKFNFDLFISNLVWTKVCVLWKHFLCFLTWETCQVKVLKKKWVSVFNFCQKMYMCWEQEKEKLFVVILSKKNKWCNIILFPHMVSSLLLSFHT